MNGALSNMPVGILDPRSQAIAQMGMSLLASGGPSRNPVSFGQSFGQAGMQGMQTFQQAQKEGQERQLYDIKMAEVQREAEERKRKQAGMDALRNDPRFAGMGPLLDVAPSVAIDRAIPKPKDPANPFTRLDPKDYTRESLTAFQQTGNVADLVAAPRPQGPQSDLGRLEADYKAGLIAPQDYQAKRAKLTAPSSPLVQMPSQETAFQREVGKQMGEQYTGLLKADMNAPASIAKYQRLGQLLGNVNTGKFKGTITDMKAAAKSIGFDLNALGISDDVAPAQAARALSNQIALELRNPAGGAGMPGALSDKDREFLIQSIPGLENDPGAIGKMIEYRVKLEQRAQKVARMARDYRRKNGKFDEGFYDELAEWSEKNPLFANEASSTPAAPKPGATTRIRFDAQGNPIQ